MIRLAAVLAAVCLSLTAQRQHVRGYSVVDGLPSAQVRSIAQDGEGRLWFSTRGGLAAYDGAQWEVFGVTDGLREPQGPLYRDDSGALWSATFRTPIRVHRRRGDVWEQLPVEVLPRGTSVTDLVVDSGRELVIVVCAGLWCWDGERWMQHELVGPNGELMGPEGIEDIEIWRDHLWVATRHGLARLSLDDPQAAPTWIEDLPDPRVEGLSGDADCLWIVGWEWIAKLDDQVRVISTKHPKWMAAHVQAVVRADGDGGVFVGDYAFLSHVDGSGVVRKLGQSSGLAAGGATDVLVDREGNTWVASLRGVFKMASYGFQTWTTRHGLFEDEVSAALRRRDGSFVLGHHGALTTLRPGTGSAAVTTKITGLDPIQNRVLEFAETEDETLWIAANRAGLLSMTKGSQELRRHGHLPGASWTAAVILDRRERVWVACDGGLARFSNGEFKRVDTGFHRADQRSHVVRRVREAPNGDILAAVVGHGLARIADNGDVSEFTAEKPRLRNIYDILPRANGDVLLATAGGLARLDGARIVHEDRPGHPSVADRAAYFVVEGPGGAIAIGTEHGVLLWEDGKLESYGLADGLLGAETNRDAGIFEADGSLWVGTERGWSVLSPERRRRMGPGPIASLLGVHDGETLRPLTGPVELAEGTIELRLRGIGLTNEDAMRFRYRLVGVDADWVGPVALPHRFVRYPRLDPGEYVFEFEVLDATGASSGIVASPTISILSPVWMRWWFLVGIGAVALAVAWLAVGSWFRRRYLQRLETEVRQQTAALALSERELAADRERLSATFENAADGLVVTDAEGRVVLWNRAAATITGRTEVEVLSGPIAAALGIAPADRDRLEGVLVRSKEVALSFRRADGEVRTIEVSASELGARDSGAVLAFRDITARRSLERELARVERLESLGLVAGGIAHDFNNHLTVIMGTLSVLREESGGEDRSRIRLAEQASDRAHALTQQLLTFAKGGAPIRRPTSVLELVRDTVTFALSGSSVLGEVQVEPDLWAANVDKAQIGDVLNNLVLNARQAMPDGGVVTAAARNRRDPSGLPAGRFVEIEIRDQGRGISPEDLDRIFDPFFTRREDGTGLGLAVAHSVMRRHEGQIRVESEVGVGTTFRLYLPAQELPVVEVAPAPAIRTAPSQRVLLMDDVEGVRDVLVALCEALGHDVVATSTGEDAVVLYRDSFDRGEVFDIVILDLTVKGRGIGGRQTAREILAIDPEARILAATGHVGSDVEGECRALGFRAVLSKPVRLADLAEALAEHGASKGRARRGSADGHSWPESEAMQ